MKTDFVYWVRGREYAAMAEKSIASVRSVYGDGANFFIYTDDEHIDWGSANALIIRMPYGRPAMVANLDAQCSYLTDPPRGASGRFMFLDVDTITRMLFPWEDGVDLYVTWRDHVGVKDGEKVAGFASLMPYNYGVVAGKRNARTIEAFLWIRARILQMAPTQQQWYGNQLALADLCAAPNRGDGLKIRNISWSMSDFNGTPLIIKTLPCEVWNYTPESDDEDVSSKGILHLKGKRKHLMESYAA